MVAHLLVPIRSWWNWFRTWGLCRDSYILFYARQSSVVLLFMVPPLYVRIRSFKGAVLGRSCPLKFADPIANSILWQSRQRWSIYSLTTLVSVDFCVRFVVSAPVLFADSIVDSRFGKDVSGLFFFMRHNQIVRSLVFWTLIRFGRCLDFVQRVKMPWMGQSLP